MNRSCDQVDRFTYLATAVAVCAAGVLVASTAEAADGGARALSRRPIATDPAWRQEVLTVPGPYARPRSVRVEGDSGGVTDPDGVLAEGGAAARLRTTGASSTRLVVDLGVLV